MSDITIVVDCNDADFARDICAALQQFPDVTALLPHNQAARDAQYASCWFPDPQLLTRSPGLKLIQAASAGVDHLPPALFASEIPLCRVIDEDFRHGMFEYACGASCGFSAISTGRWPTSEPKPGSSIPSAPPPTSISALWGSAKLAAISPTSWPASLSGLRLVAQ